MPKRKFPRLIKGVSYCWDKNTLHTEVAILEDKDNTYLFAGWIGNGGYVVIPFKTQLEAVMLYQMVLERMNKNTNAKTELTAETVTAKTRYSWNWIRNRVKNGEKVVQAFYNTDSLKLMFGSKLAERILDFIK